MPPKKTDESLSLSHSLPYPFTTPCFKPFFALSLAHVPLSNPFRISSPDPLTVPCPLFPAYTTTPALLDLFTHSSASVSFSAYQVLSPVPFPVHFTSAGPFFLSVPILAELPGPVLSLQPCFKSFSQHWLQIHLLFYAPTPLSYPWHRSCPFLHSFCL